MNLLWKFHLQGHKSTGINMSCRGKRMRIPQKLNDKTFIPFFVQIDTIFGGLFIEINEKERRELTEKKRNLNAILEERVMELIFSKERN